MRGPCSISASFALSLAYCGFCYAFSSNSLEKAMEIDVLNCFFFGIFFVLFRLSTFSSNSILEIIYLLGYYIYTSMGSATFRSSSSSSTFGVGVLKSKYELFVLFDSDFFTVCINIGTMLFCGGSEGVFTYCFSVISSFYQIERKVFVDVWIFRLAGASIRRF